MPWQSLKSALLFNATVCAVFGIPLVTAGGFFAGLASAHVGAIPAWLATAVGAVLLILAVDLAWVATRNPIPRALARLLTLADAAFVLVTPVIMVAAAPWLSSIGQVLLADLALITAFCVWCQWRGLRQFVNA